MLFRGLAGCRSSPSRPSPLLLSAFRGVRFLLFPSVSGLTLVVSRVGGVFVSFSSLLRSPLLWCLCVVCCCSSNARRTQNPVPTKALPVVPVVPLAVVLSRPLLLALFPFLVVIVFLLLFSLAPSRWSFCWGGLVIRCFIFRFISHDLEPAPLERVCVWNTKKM